LAFEIDTGIAARYGSRGSNPSPPPKKHTHTYTLPLI
jgi:hypothetical protein